MTRKAASDGFFSQKNRTAMKNPTRISRFTLSLLSSSVALACLAMPAAAQSKSGSGLDALDDNRVRETLATMEMEDLLERSFNNDNVPMADRDGIRAMISLNRLVNQDTSKLNATKRRQIVTDVTAGLDKAMKTMKDTRALMNLAGKLYTIGVANESALLEYWGEDTATQAQMKPAAEAILKIYTKAEGEATAKMNAVANQIKDPNQVALMKQLDQLQILMTTIQYTKMSSQYFVALSLDKADPNRAKLCDETITYLKQWDDPTSTIQPAVKNQIGKLQIVKGDFDASVTIFKSLYEDPSKLNPKPTLFEMNDARFFSAIALLLSQNPDAAEKQLQETIEWQKTNFTEPKQLQAVVDADEVLKARIAWLRGDLAAKPEDKAKFNDQASTILTKLMRDNPGLRSLILDRLINRLPATAELKKLDLLLLQALMERGKTEFAKAEAKEPFDKAAIEKGIGAAREILARKGQPGVDKEAVTTALTVIPFFAQKLDQPKVAAAGFLEYAQAQQADIAKADDAWQQAMRIIILDFHAPNTDDAEISALYDRAISMGINPPFNHKELAYSWARRIQSLLGSDESTLVAKNDEVIRYLKMVPPTAPEALNAKYWLSIALSTKLDKDPKLTPAEKSAVLAEIQTTSDQISSGAKDALDKLPPAPATPPAAGDTAALATERKRNTYRQMLVRTPLLAAGLAQSQQKDPKLALKLLENYEDLVKGLPNEDLLLGDALQTRVLAYMDIGENLKATDTLVVALQKKGANEGIKMVYDLLQRLNKDIDAAFARGDMAKVGELAPNRAVLTGFLYKWASENKDPKVREKAYGYGAFDADSKRLAASLEKDPAKRKALLDATLKAYETLAALPQGANDPNIQFGLALTNYDLGNYEKARDSLLDLLRKRRLGEPMTLVSKNGQSELQSNDLYWEARLKLLRANVELAKVPPGNPDLMKQVAAELRLIYTQFGKTTGGAKWAPEFEKLRLELDPTIKPDEFVAPTTTPTTQDSSPEL